MEGLNRQGLRVVLAGLKPGRGLKAAPRVCALILVVVFGLAGCSLRGGKKAKAAAPPPKPAPTASASAPEAPLSVPQTRVQLPPPQPVNPLAVAEPQAPQEPQAPEPAAAPQAKPARRSAPVAAAPKPAEPSPSPAVLPQAPVEERPRLQEIVSPEERKKLTDQMSSRKKEIEETLRIVAARPLSDHDRNIVDRVRRFLQQSDEAGSRGEMRQADALSERALILARELRVAR